MRTELSHCERRQFALRLAFAALLLQLAVSGFAFGGTSPATTPTPQLSAKKMLKAARKQERKGLYSDALMTLRAAHKQYPRNDDVTLDLAYIYLKLRMPLDAYGLAFRVAQKDSKNSYAFAIIGTVQLEAGNFREARALLTNAIALDKREALAWASIGMLEFYENNISESILNLREAVHHDWREPDFEYALAQVASRGEKYKESAEAYERFLRISPKTDLERRNRIQGLIKFLKYLGSRASIYDLAGAASTTVDTRIINNRPIVPLKIGDYEEELDFVLDTGSGISVLSEETAERMKVKPVAAGGKARALGGDGKFDIVYGFIDVIRIGEVKVRNVPVYIRKFQKSSTKVDGYIGLSLISKYITTIDYKNSKLSLIDKDAFQETPEMVAAMTIPLRLTTSGFLSGDARLPGIDNPLHFILDTGASVSVVSNDLAERESIRQHILEETMRVVGAAGITDDVPLFMLRDFSFGGISKPELKAVALNMDVLNETSGFAQSGILGGNFLRDYKLTFDFKRSKVTFVPY